MSSNNTRANDAKRFDHLIKRYHEFYRDKRLNHSELADLILEEQNIPVSHKTLRMRIGEWRHEQEIQGQKQWVKSTTTPQTPKPSFEDVLRASGGMMSGPMGIPGNNDRGIDPSLPPLRYKALPFTGNQNDGREKTYIVSGCWHFPFHNKAMWKAYLKLTKNLIESNQLTGIIFAGDILDMHSISRHSKGKITMPGLTLSKEYAEANKIFNELDNVIGTYKLEKEYSYGNHEMWYSQHMKEVDNAKLGDEVIKGPEEAVRLKERGFNVQKDYATAHWRLGRDLEVIHGDYVTVHAAHAHLQKMKRSVMFFHTHRLSRFDEGPLEGHNCGWGGDKNQKVFSYMSRVQKETWKNGFAVVKIDEKGYTHVTQITWRNNGFYYGDRFFNAD